MEAMPERPQLVGDLDERDRLTGRRLPRDIDPRADLPRCRLAAPADEAVEQTRIVLLGALQEIEERRALVHERVRRMKTRVDGRARWAGRRDDQRLGERMIRLGPDFI